MPGSQFCCHKVRRYLLAHTIRLVSKANPIKYFLKWPVLRGRLGKWALQIAEFDIYYVPLNAVKGQAVADFLAEDPVPLGSPLNDILEEVTDVFMVDIPLWRLYFNGSTATEKAGM